MKDYKIAGHCLSIDFFDNGINEKLLPNLAPFAYDGSEPPAITLRIVTDYEWAQEVHEVGTFGRRWQQLWSVPHLRRRLRV